MIEAGDTAWVLVSAALVLFMTPGLALFYGGMVRSKNVLAMLMMNWVALSIVTVIWVLFGFSFAFSTDIGGGLLGNLDFVGLKELSEGVVGTIPSYAFFAFQLMFAIITPALISGAVGERMKFSAWVVFCTLWSIVVYLPVAHWAFAGDGWIFSMGARDFAGGLVVHINAGIAALAVIIVLGPRREFRKSPTRPHNLPFTLLGAGILWFGWFGFNAGSALAANGIAANAMVTTQIAAAVAGGAWITAEWLRTGKPTTLGMASGAVAGLVAITPAAGFVSPIPAMVIGVVAGVLCYFAVSVKFKLGYDDALDVVGVHLVGGLIGSIFLGILAQESVNPGVIPDGLLFGGGGFFARQMAAIGAVLAFSFVATYLIAKGIDLVMGLRVSPTDETQGLDIALHEETAYSLSD